jgi:hypothetical protein
MWYEVLQAFEWVSYSGREPDQQFDEGDYIRMNPDQATPLLRDGKIRVVSPHSVFCERVIPGGRTD